jgi:hypothetical protein
MRLISVKFVPRLLSDDQKAHHVSVCRELKQQASDDPSFISSIITSDETWVYGYPETKQQSLQWKNSLQPEKVCQVCSIVKSMLIIFFDIQGSYSQGICTPWQPAEIFYWIF